MKTHKKDIALSLILLGILLIIFAFYLKDLSMKQTHKWQYQDKIIKVTSDDSKTLIIEINHNHKIDKIVMKSIFKEDLQSKEFEKRIEKILKGIYE